MGAPLSRRHFLIAGLAVPATAAIASSAQAQVVTVDRHTIFTEAATAYGVPASVLAAVSYAQTRWQHHEGTPSASLGYGPMHLIDGAAAQEARARADKPETTTLDTLGDAASAAGASPEAVRTDPETNIRAGAALLAALQRAAGGPTGTSTDPGTWYSAVAAASGLPSSQGQLDFADETMRVIRTGATVELGDGSSLTLPPRAISSTDTQRAPLARRASQAAGERRPSGPIDAPTGLDVEWIPAPYEQYGPAPGDYGNHDLARRPAAPTITHIVIHDTEGYWKTVLDLVQDPTYVSWQYSLRSSDGHIAQHLVPGDVGWHAGNWYLNMHSIGLEHEGFAAQGAPWFSEPMYRTSATLVRYLARKYGIPMDRAHIIGHDQIPGVTTANIPGMHWDPGPFWDWEHYFELMGAPLNRGTATRPVKVGDVVRIVPGFVGNKQPVTGCEAGKPASCGDKDTNFVTLRRSPAADAPLVNDIGLHQKGQPASTEVSDISARATAGTEFVVAELAGDWTAIWYLGLKAWFHNPAARPTARVVVRPPKVARPKAGRATVPVYGRCYPEASAYTNPADVQPVLPLIYAVPAGQAYVVSDEAPPTDYYKAKTFSLATPGDHIDIVGKDPYVQVSLGHRVAFMRVADIDVD
ncbi:N-acetylmuramoyl-L-alanine amidase [Luteipulveratus flavus]|uniref:N-acetylmuramoyl-L-alanine amidase n=1 Tax=Luteipulveratus flavus TaxID=3031728 RepID=A0ABT6C852_9MICO|nr:N-acetylmuramoyl-L-alanine amidase [Luteipulveratus sp. YIM 133296]MDF8265114.1 N-acetylmuramoyl-L-alanine amidase [Luteipulveratus sp. YIM 133296]